MQCLSGFELYSRWVPLVFDWLYFVSLFDSIFAMKLRQATAKFPRARYVTSHVNGSF